MISFIFIFVASALVCALLTFLIVISSKYITIGQSIREEGPSSHSKKTGTPTMGGIAILVSIICVVLVFIDVDVKMIAALLLLVGFALIGFADDYLKIISKKNGGISPRTKMVLQIVLSMAFGTTLLFMGHESQVTGLLKLLYFNSGWLYLPLIAFMIVAASNACNLTDGLDGLLAGTALIAFIAFAIISARLEANDIAMLCTVVSGTLAGFLVFNHRPAKIFMGDTGSLSIGALLAAVAILAHKELMLLLIGGVFVAETLSVMIQVFYFKKTGKRVFKMSPLHHHFELSGMKEDRIVIMFWLVSAVLGILAVLIR